MSRSAISLSDKPVKAGLLLLLIIMTTFILGKPNNSNAAEPEAAVISLAGGNGAGCVLVDGGLRCWGTSVSTGSGSGHDLPVPTWVNGLQTGVSSVSLGSGFGCAVLNTGAAKCWGYNNMGQLGNGTTTYSLLPVNVVGLPDKIKQIATGYTHTCVLLNNGQVWCWGNNANYQLGRTGWSDSNPTQVTTAFAGNVLSLSAGGAHTCARLEGGGVQCWGYGYYGSLGNGTSGNSADTAVAQNVLGLAGKVTQLQAGYYHTCVLLETGAVQCWGLFGDFSNTKATSLTAFGTGNQEIAVNGGHLCVLDALRKARCQGEGTSGQLGDGNKSNSGTPVEVSVLTGGVSKISTGNAHTCAVWGSEVYCWGGILGAGASKFTTSPWRMSSLPTSTQQLTSGSSHACALVNSAAYCWGGNLNGALGIGNSDWQSYYSPQSVLNASSNVSNIDAGLQYSCAVINGAAKCWGRNEYGQLGTGNQTEANQPTQVSGLTSGMARVFTNRAGGGQTHTCATTIGGQAYCWGGNFAAQLGSGSITNIELTPLPVVGLTSGVGAMALGVSHTCASVNGSAMCWGYGYYGEIGNGVSGTNEKYTSPQSVSGLGSGVTQVAGGGNFTCALANGGVKCWGKNDNGQLGNGTTSNASIPQQVTGLSSGVSAISAGTDYACAVASGAVKCWGKTPLFDSLAPQTVNNLESGILDISAGMGVLFVRTSTQVAALGTDNYGLLGSPTQYSLPTPKRLLGFAASPELVLQANLAKPGSTLHIAGGGFPASTRLPLLLNGRVLGNITTDGVGFFSLVLDTQGQPSGGYTLQVLTNGTPFQVYFNLDASAPLVQANNGGVYFGMSSAVPEPTPQPTPTPDPGVSPTPSPDPQVDQIIPSSGDRAIPVRVEIYGERFQPGAVARLAQGVSEIPALETLYISSGHLQAVWPGALVGSPFDVVVVNPDWSKGKLAAAYLPIDVVGAPGSDLFGYENELGIQGGEVQAGTNVNFSFVLRRLGGIAVLNNVRVRLYWGDSWITDPVTQGTLIGDVNTPALAPNQWALIEINHLAPAAGSYQLFAVIDPSNQVAETDESNNIVQTRFIVVPPPYTPPEDTTPPLVDAVSSDTLWTSSESARLTVSAHDEAGGSGVAWVYVFTWEYFPGLRDWLVTEESGWMYYNGSAASQSYWLPFGYFEGPRFFSVYVADQARNISLESGSSIVNYIKPNNFVAPGESHLFAFPLLAGQAFGATLQNAFSDNDADLYLWPPEYPSRNYWASATPGSVTETLNVSIPVNGWYWLEVYGYNFSYYNLTLGLAGLTTTVEPSDLTSQLEAVRPRTNPLALGEDTPNQRAIVPAVTDKVFLPLIKR